MTIYRDFRKALMNIGITSKEIAERKLSLHGWRHFLNTELLKGGLTLLQTQAVTRHKSESMTEWHNHFDPAEFAKALAVQEALLTPETEKPQEATAANGDERRINVFSFPAPETGLERKQA
jgi:integrase